MSDDEKFFAQKPNSLSLTAKTPYFEYTKEDFSVQEMYNILEEVFDKGEETAGSALLSVVKPRYNYIQYITMGIYYKHTYGMLIHTSDGNDLYWWDPNKDEYIGNIYNPEPHPYPKDKRTLVNNIKYAQILFYEVYKYGKLSDNALMNFRSLLDKKPAYYLVPKELL